MRLDRLEELAAPTHGVFTAPMAARAGFAPHQLGRLRRAGVIRRVVGHGLTVGTGPLTMAQRHTAAALTWPDSIVCFRSAATEYRLLPDRGGDVDVLVPRARRPMLGLTPHFWSIRPTEVVRRDRWAVTDFRTTLADCLGRLPDTDAWGMLAWEFTRDRITAEDVEAQLRERYHLYGVARLRVMADALRRRAVSPPEVTLQEFLDGRGFTGWAGNAPIRHRGWIVASADVLFEAERLCVDYDGRASHGPDQQAYDARRDALLTSLGYRVFRVRWEQLSLRPDLLEVKLRRLLSESPPAPAAGSQGERWTGTDRL